MPIVHTLSFQLIRHLLEGKEVIFKDQDGEDMVVFRCEVLASDWKVLSEIQAVLIKSDTSADDSETLEDIE